MFLINKELDSKGVTFFNAFWTKELASRGGARAAVGTLGNVPSVPALPVLSPISPHFLFAQNEGKGDTTCSWRRKQLRAIIKARDRSRVLYNLSLGI